MDANLEMEILFHKYIELDKPIPFKDNRLLIQPILVDECFDFLQSIDILQIDKDTYGSIEEIQMSYLAYLYNLMSDGDVLNLATKLDTILHLCVQIVGSEYNPMFIKTNVDDKGRALIVFSTFSDNANHEGDIELNAREFDELKRIILHQNIVNFSDKYIDPYLRKAYNEYWDMKNRDIEIPTIDKQIAIVQSMNGMSKQDIFNMTYRSFKILFDTCADKVDYQINKSAEMSGVEFKHPIEHWIYKRKKSMYENAFQSMDSYKNAMKSVT